MSRVIACLVALGTVGALAALAGENEVWKPFLSENAYQALVKRSKERMAGAKNDKARQAEQQILAGYASSVKGAPTALASKERVRLGAIMNLFRTQAKGGEGIAPELQYSAKVKNQNGIEALINALAAKKLSTANADKMAKELELLGDRVAVIGSLTLQHGPPAKKKSEAKAWSEQSIAMRDAAIELAEGAQKKDATRIHEASKRLENTCVECHSVFK